MSAGVLAALATHANPRGLVLAHERRLRAATGLGRSAIAKEVSRLAGAGAVRVLSPLPFLVCKLLSWSGERPPRTRHPQQSGPMPRFVPMDVPVSSAAAGIYKYSKQQLDGGAGEGALLGRVLAVLGPEADPAEFRELVAQADPDLVRRCLRRVQATRAIRVSRAALFRSLLGRLRR